MADAVEAYFTELRDIRAMGGAVAEISYYPAVRQLLDEVGKHLKPKVRALMQLRNAGAGNPDGGLFTQNQWRIVEESVDPLSGQIPARGAIEVKGTVDDAFAVAASEQVAKYAERYGLVLVTNLRDWVLVRWEDGQARVLESLRLAPDERTFLTNLNHPQTFANVAGEGLTEFLKRVMLQNAPLSEPKDLAWFLASYARTARLRLEHTHELPALDQLRSQLEDALGLKFEGEKGDHFFRSTLVQTLFYGVFAAWVLAEEAHVTGRFEWRHAADTLDVPFISALFYQFANPARLGPLGIAEVLDWTQDALNRVDHASFFERFRKEHAVQYFYEPFLEAFDPQLRKELGVWYTPDEVVRYMVARVDWALREELGIADGLADESVWVLDPCCGTGAYLVEVLRTIDRTLEAKGADALTRQDVKRAAMSRIIGFEIMPAPFVIAHLQLGLLLAELGVPLSHASGEHERAAVYLTNALTGWNTEDPNAPGAAHKKAGAGQLLFEFEQERDAAAKVKREAPILVVIGNPPYNSYAGMAVGEERELSEAYRTTERAPKPQGQGLNDIYVRFFRMAERQITERTGRGVVCLISNNSWLDSLSFTGMRERFLGAFDRIWIDNLNGDKYRTGKLTPAGAPDPSVFSTEKNREGIQVGTAIALLVRGTGRSSRVAYADWWGAKKRGELVEAAVGTKVPTYQEHEPVLALGLSFRPVAVAPGYLRWPRLPDILPVSFPGVKTSRDDFVVDVERNSLEERIRTYLDPSISDIDIANRWPSIMASNSAFSAAATRHALVAKGFVPEQVIRYGYRPFDIRWLYWEPDTKLLDRERSDYRPNVDGKNRWLSAGQRARTGTLYQPQVLTVLADHHLVESNVGMFPEHLLAPSDALLPPRDNLSSKAAAYVQALSEGVGSVFDHIVAVAYAPGYVSENLDALVSDWPRIPLPSGVETLRASAALGSRVASLLDPLQAFSIDLGVGRVSSSTGVSLDPAEDLALTARWGIAGRGGITMPSTGKLTERPHTADERAAIAEAAAPLGMSGDEATALLGESCFDVWLNDVAYWRCVPANVWRYTIGGYQVIKKWLSYREKALLGRDLKPEEARYVTEMVRRIAALVLMGPELDANYERVKADVWEWGT